MIDNSYSNTFLKILQRGDTNVCVNFTVDGGWSDWGNWNSCTVTCNNGVHTRTRTCNNPRPSPGGKECQGRYTDTQICNFNTCPGNTI